MRARFEPLSTTGLRRRRIVFGAPRRQVLTKCPRSGLSQATHARLTVRQFAVLEGPLLYWCGRCRAPHEARRDMLWLAADGDLATASQPPYLTAVILAPREAVAAAANVIVSEELVFTGRGAVAGEALPPWPSARRRR